MNLPAQPRPGRRRRGPMIILLLLAGALVLFFGVRIGPPPTLHVELDQPGVGQRPMTVSVEVAEPRRGLSAIGVEAIQGERVTLVTERRHRAAPAWAFWRDRVAKDRFDVVVGKDNVPGLEAGELLLRVTAERAGGWLRHGSPAIVERAIPVSFDPPRLAVWSSPNRAVQGGAGLVVYTLGERARVNGARHGVEVGERLFPGHAVPGSTDPARRFALFAVPFDVAEANPMRLVAVDPLGNRSAIAFLDTFAARPPTTDTIALSERFFEAVVPEILSQTPSLEAGATLLDSYLAINGDLRRANATELVELSAGSRPALLWSGAFRQLPGSQVTSSFADRRSYVFEGRIVDHQDHLGYDLASVRHALVPAANGGVVALARYFGIYGNTVVIDHGYGLMTLYSHLSSIAVRPGDEVAQGEIVGRTGETGLAAGDHLHFTTLIGGVPVDPIEWFDPRWVRNHITDKLAAAIGPLGPDHR